MKQKKNNIKRVFYFFKSYVLLIILLIVLSFTLVACDNGMNDSSSIIIMVSDGDGYSVVGDNIVKGLKAGDTVKFKINVDDGYWFKDVSDGEYKNSVLILNDVKFSETVRFNVIKKPELNRETDVLCSFHYDDKFNLAPLTMPATKNKNFYLLDYKDTAFSKEGYTLAGWKEGKEEIHSLGAMITTEESDKDFIAIWEKQNPESDFTYREYIDPNGEERTGIEIIGLSESGKKKKKIVLPEKINNTDVVSIGEGAFDGESLVETLILKPELNQIKLKAFNNMTSLRNFTMYDDIRYLENDIFVGSNKLQHFTMHGASVRVYDKMLHSSVVDKIARVKNTKKKKIVTISGSSGAYGFDSGTLYQNEIIKNYDFIVTGVQAQLGMNYIIDAIKNDMCEGDVLILSFEYGYPIWKYDHAAKEYLHKTLYCLNCNWDLLQYYDFRSGYYNDIINFMKNWSDYRRPNLDKNIILNYNVGRYNSVDKHGIYTFIRPNVKQGTLDNRHGNMFKNTMPFFHTMISNLNKYIRYFQEKGVTVYYVHPPFYKYLNYDDENCKKERENFHALLVSNICCDVLGTIDQSSQPIKNMFNTLYHLSTNGAKEFSVTFANLIEEALKKENK